MGKLDGKSALVTGAGRGIGRSIALKLAGEGARVVVNDLDEASAREVVEEIRDNGGTAVPFPGSVTGDGFATAFVDAAVDSFGGVGIIINISSVAGLFGNAGQANYSAAKAGLVGLTKTLAKEWGRYHVNVSCVAFGFIQTRLTEAAADGDAYIDVEGRQIKVGVNPQLLETLNRLIPLGRAGTPDEAAGSVVMFTYPEADYVSGQVIVTGGGFEG